MHKRDHLFRQRLLALRRYISAMEQGDIESAAAVLHEARQDQALEHMVLELNTIYQEIDQNMVSAQEAHMVYQQLLAPVVNQEISRPAQHNGPFSQQDHTFLIDETHTPPARRLSTMQEQETPPMPTLAGTRLPRRPPVRTTRVGRLIHIMAAVVAVCALSGTILLVLAYHRTGTAPTGSSATTLHAIVAVTTSNGTVYGLRADNGHQLWKFTAPKVQEGVSTGDATIVQGQVVYALLNSQVYALRATDGALLWHRSLFIEGTRQDSYDMFLFDHNTLYVSGTVFGDQPIPQGNVYALHANDGSIAWHSTGSYSPLLTVHAGIAYVVTQDQASNLELHALRGDTGQQLWQYATEVISAVADDHTVYVYSGAPLTLDVTKEHKEDRTLAALNVQNGKVRWSVPIVAGDSGALIIGQDKVFVEKSGKTSYQFCAYQTSNGKQAWCTSEQTMSPFPTPMTTSTVTNNAFYVLAVTRSNAGDFATRLVGYRESDGQQLRWTRNIADPTSKNIAEGNGLVFVSTVRHVWAINPAGQQIWVYDNPQHILPSGVGAGGLRALSFGSW